MARKIRAGLPASAHHRKKAPEVLADIGSFARLEAELGFDGVLNYGTMLDESKADPVELLDFLRRNESRAKESWAVTQYPKLVCV